MAITYLDFEEPIAQLEKRIEQLHDESEKSGLNAEGEIQKLHLKLKRLRRDTFANLTRWQRTRLARHPERPITSDYISLMTTDFVELYGDRTFADGVSIISGFARIDGRKVMLIGNQKGRDTKEKLKRNFGMSHPEGYRKAIRVMKLAEKFSVPVLTLLDTPGAYPGIGAEERGQSEAIAKSMMEMSSLKVPVISVVIGEGGSGGALALGVANRVLILENSVYSVISPEGCAAILWKDPEKVEEAAEALSHTSADLKKFGIVDEVIKEPTGGAHRKVTAMASILRRAVRRNLEELGRLSPEELVSQRRKKFRTIGSYAT